MTSHIQVSRGRAQILFHHADDMLIWAPIFIGLSNSVELGHVWDDENRVVLPNISLRNSDQQMFQTLKWTVVLWDMGGRVMSKWSFKRGVFQVSYFLIYPEDQIVLCIPVSRLPNSSYTWWLHGDFLHTMSDYRWHGRDRAHSNQRSSTWRY